MKIMERNKQSLFYCLFDTSQAVTNAEGDETGEYKVTYKAEVEMKANISAATGYAQVEQFGNFITYDKVIVTDDMSCPIDENTVLFIDKAPEYDKDGNPLFDYTVRRVAKSLNSIAIAVSKVNVS